MKKYTLRKKNWKKFNSYLTPQDSTASDANVTHKPPQDSMEWEKEFEEKFTEKYRNVESIGKKPYLLGISNRITPGQKSFQLEQIKSFIHTVIVEARKEDTDHLIDYLLTVLNCRMDVLCSKHQSHDIKENLERIKAMKGSL